jgi:hypothetical protein
LAKKAKIFKKGQICQNAKCQKYPKLGFFGQFWLFWPILAFLANFGFFGQFWLFWQILEFFRFFGNFLDFLEIFGFFGKFWIFWNKLLFVISEAT